jgi:uncharacterized protein
VSDVIDLLEYPKSNFSSGEIAVVRGMGTEPTPGNQLCIPASSASQLWRQTVYKCADTAPAREVSVVCSCHGRLRVHLPCWIGTRAAEIGAEVKRLIGVTHAEANPLTGNLLILFQPRETTRRSLLQDLPSMRLQISQPLALVEESEAMHTEPGRYVTRTKRATYEALGWGSVGISVVGAKLPGIPTAPFVIRAGCFFIRSSPEAHRWLRESRWFGTILRDWEDHCGVMRFVRNAALLLFAVGISVTFWLGLPPLFTAVIVAMELFGSAIVMTLRVVASEEAESVAEILHLYIDGR